MAQFNRLIEEEIRKEYIKSRNNYYSMLYSVSNFLDIENAAAKDTDVKLMQYRC